MTMYAAKREIRMLLVSKTAQAPKIKISAKITWFFNIYERTGCFIVLLYESTE